MTASSQAEARPPRDADALEVIEKSERSPRAVLAEGAQQPHPHHARPQPVAERHRLATCLCAFGGAAEPGSQEGAIQREEQRGRECLLQRAFVGQRVHHAQGVALEGAQRSPGSRPLTCRDACGRRRRPVPATPRGRAGAGATRLHVLVVGEGRLIPAAASSNISRRNSAAPPQRTASPLGEPSCLGLPILAERVAAPLEVDQAAREVDLLGRPVEDPGAHRCGAAPLGHGHQGRQPSGQRGCRRSGTAATRRSRRRAGVVAAGKAEVAARADDGTPGQCCSATLADPLRDPLSTTTTSSALPAAKPAAAASRGSRADAGAAGRQHHDRHGSWVTVRPRGARRQPRAPRAPERAAGGPQPEQLGDPEVAHERVGRVAVAVPRGSCSASGSGQQGRAARGPAPGGAAVRRFFMQGAGAAARKVFEGDEHGRQGRGMVVRAGPARPKSQGRLELGRSVRGPSERDAAGNAPGNASSS